MFRYRQFQITINNLDNVDNNTCNYTRIKEVLKQKGYNYLISCIEEAPETGHLHIHIYVQFPKVIRLSTRELFGAHIEMCKGSTQENIDYIEKIKNTFNIDNILDREGTPRMSSIKKAKLAIDLIDVPFEEIKKNDLKVWEKVNGCKSLQIDELYKGQPTVYYIWGDSGSGKSKKVFDLISQEEDKRLDRVKHVNNFWMGVNTINTPEICWYDDFRDTHMPVSEFINFIDYYKNQMNIKFCPQFFNPYKKIFITSIQSPEEIYRNIQGEPRRQWLRRITHVIHMDNSEEE